MGQALCSIWEADQESESISSVERGRGEDQEIRMRQMHHLLRSSRRL